MEELLVVEDNIHLNKIICENLKLLGYKTLSSYNGLDALAKVVKNHSELLIIDLILPKMNGLELIRKIRLLDITTPIIVITSDKDIIYEINSYKKGANLFHQKPINFDLLLTQVQSVLTTHNSTEKPIVIKSLKVDKLQSRVIVDHTSIKLTKSELRILSVLSNSPDTTIRREKLLSVLSDNNKNLSEKWVNTLICRIRYKLRKEIDSNFIETIWGVGYKLDSNYL